MRCIAAPYQKAYTCITIAQWYLPEMQLRKHLNKVKVQLLTKNTDVLITKTPRS